MNLRHFLVAVFCGLVQITVFAQQHPFSSEVVVDGYGNETMPYARGEVIRRMDFSNPQVPDGFQDRYKTTMDKITDITTGWNKLSPPQGFRATFHKIIDIAYDDDIYESPNNDPAPYYVSRLEIVFEPYFKGETGKPEVSPQGVGSVLTLSINNPYWLVGSPLINDIYVCPRKTSDFYGYPVYQTNRDEITVVGKKQIPLFIPVSQEEYIRAQIAFWENEMAKKQNEQQKPENQLSIKEAFNAKKAERLKNMEEAYNTLLKYDKKAAEELKRTSLETEAQLAADLVNDPDANLSKSRLLEDSNSSAQQILTELKAELAALSPEQRKKQAHYDVNAMERYHNRSGLVPFEQAKPRVNCEPLVRINKKIVDDRNPEPQLIVILWDILSSGAESHQNPQFLDSDKENYRAHTGDEGLAGLYKQQGIWQNIFGLVVK